MASREDSKVSFSATTAEVEVVSSMSYCVLDVAAIEEGGVGCSGTSVS